VEAHSRAGEGTDDPSVVDLATLDNNSRNWQLEGDHRSQPAHEACAPEPPGRDAATMDG